MKELDNLIEKYKGIQLSFSIGSEEYNKLGHVWMDLESLKQSIKEQHKKDVVEAYDKGRFNNKSWLTAEQYYNDNY